MVLKSCRVSPKPERYNHNWRLTFWLKDNEIFDLDLEDYH